MKKDAYYHQRFFRTLYSDMVRRINQYKTIQQIENEEVRRECERIFLEEQTKIIRKFILQEEYARSQLKKGLKRQQQDIESWWKRHIEFRRIKRNCIDRFDNLIAFAEKIEAILSKQHFEQRDTQTLISEIEDELKTIIHLSNDYEIRRYGQGILAFCKRNKASIIGLAVIFLMVSSIAIYVFSNYHITPKDSQTYKVHFILDDMTPDDWAVGEHYSYGFYSMLSKIVDYQKPLGDLQYTAYPDQRYGNPDAKILLINVGASKLLPSFMRNSFGDNIIMEVQALNKGETVIKIVKENKPILEVTFHQDKVAHIQWNDFSYPNEQMKKAYHSVREGIEYRVNTN